MVEAGINQQQLAAMERKLERFARAIARPTEANREASVALYGFVARNFQREGSLVGGWAPLAPATVRQKARIGKERMLVRSGALKGSFVPFHSDVQAGVGSELEYSKYQHDGTATIPPRQLLPNREQTLDIGLRVYGQFVERKVAEANR